MDKEYLQDVYDYLDAQHKEYYSATLKQKNIVENRVRLYSHNLKNKLYSFLNEDYASGLFEHGFLSRIYHASLKKLKDELQKHM